MVGGVEIWAEVKTKGFIEPKGSSCNTSAEREGKEGWAEREGKEGWRCGRMGEDKEGGRV